MRARVCVLCLCVVAATGIGPAHGGDLFNPDAYDSEYELDLLQNYFHPQWVFDWHALENGFRTTGGSLNIRHIYLVQQAKFRFPLVEERLWFRFRHEVQAFLDYDRREEAIELEYAPARRLYLSMVLEPAFHKADMDIGWAIAYGAGEGNRVRAEYYLVDFDRNYAFRRKTVNEGYEEFFARAPREYRFSWYHTSDSWNAGVAARRVTPYELTHDALTATGIDMRYTGEEWAAEADLQGSLGSWSPGLHSTARVTEESRERLPLPVAGDCRSRISRYEARPYVWLRTDGPWEYLVGFGYVDDYGTREEPVDPLMGAYYRSQQLLPFALAAYQWAAWSVFEFGYMHASQFQTRLDHTGWLSGTGRENRLRVAWELVFSARMRMRCMAGIELDQEDFGRFAYFDGGSFQFQGCF